MVIDIKDFKKALSSEQSTAWNVGNAVLCKLCKDCPNHRRVDEIVAKLWLIGRSYAAAVERTKNKKVSSDEFYLEVAKNLMRSKLDIKLSKIPKGKVLTDKIIGAISDAHAYLTELLWEHTGMYKISFASKYLHFHRQIVPLYDSRAHYGIRKVFRNERVRAGLVKCFAQDLRDDGLREKEKEYIRLTLKVQELQQHLYDKTKKWHTVRDIDKYLLHLAR